MDATDAWDKTTGSASVIVAVVDTGVEHTHEDLKDNILRDGQGRVVGTDLVNNDGNPMDDNRHGTHVAGIIGARMNNRIGVAGVAPVVRIMPIKAFNAAGDADTADLIEGFQYAIDRGARVLNCSYGSPSYSQLEFESVVRARNAGVLVCAAAGNDGINADELPQYPANYNQDVDNVISVAATDHNDDLAGFSNYGAVTVDIAAPGAGVYSTVRNNGYDLISGTSMACPHVSGAAALVRARFPSITLEALKRRLLAGADRVDRLAGVVVAGRLNVDRALEPDTTAPAGPASLVATHRGETSLRLAWRAPGDDGAAGAAAQYELRYDTRPVTAASFAGARVATRLPLPAAAGTAQSALLTGLEPDTDYYVALRALDNAGNASPLATFGPVKTLAGALTVLFEDDAEGPARFVGDSPWAVTTEDRFGGSRCYTDSPGGKYADNADVSLSQAQAVTPTGSNPVLEFRARTDLELRFDNVYVEATTDGKVWHRLLTLNGTSDWALRSAPLMAFRGQPIRLRFRLVSDGDRTQNGVWLDDIRILSRPTDLCLLEENADGTPQFTGQSPWTLSKERSFSRPFGYTDSPGTRYANNANLSLTQNAAVTLSGLAPVLTFWAETDLEQGYDFLYVDVAETSSPVWQRVMAITGARPPGFYAVSLAPYFGRSVRVRFRLVSDADTQANGVWLDDIRICGERLEQAPGVVPPVPPTELTAVSDPGGVKLAWLDNSDNETGFRVERRTGSGEFQSLAVTAVNARAYTDAAVAPGVTYTYRVRALGLVSDSAPSNEASGSAASGGDLEVPQSLSFGTLRVGRRKTRTLLLRNASTTENLRVTVNTPQGPFRLTAGAGSSVIPPGGSLTVRLTFRPLKRGRSRGQLIIASSDRSLSSVTVRLSGKAK